MRLAQFHEGDRLRVGRVDGELIVPLEGFSSMLELIGAGRDGLRRVAEAVGSGVPIGQIRLAPPLRPARNPFCCGWNYAEHFSERRRGVATATERPTFFSKATTTVLSPGDPVPLHERHTRELDYEAELAVVIGSAGRDVSEPNALNHVFGYCPANDVTARDLQHSHGGQWLKGKSLDGTLPLGPWLTTADEITDPQSLDIACRLNGRIVQRANTSAMTFSIARLISELSAGMTLLPGDLILTGTPSGVGAAATPPRYLRHGDAVEVDIAGLGTLRTVVRQSSSAGAPSPMRA